MLIFQKTLASSNSVPRRQIIRLKHVFSEKAKLWGPQCKVIDFNKLVSFTNLHLQKESMNIEEFYSSKANKRTDVDFDDLEKYLRKIKYERKKINVKFGPVKENIRLKRNMLFGSSKYKKYSLLYRVNYNKKKIANTLSMKDENEINLTIKGNTPGYLEISNSIIAKNTKPFSIYNMKQTIGI